MCGTNNERLTVGLIVDQQKYAHLKREYTGTEACGNETANTVGNAINSIATSLHIGYNFKPFYSLSLSTLTTLPIYFVLPRNKYRGQYV